MGQENFTVYIVDDDESVLRSLKRLVEVAGFRPKTYGTALEFLSSGHYLRSGVLVLDVRMPEMSGLELQKRLADLGSDMPIIFITAHEDFPARRRAMEAGAVDFLLKPFEKRALLDTIQEAAVSYSSSKE